MKHSTDISTKRSRNTSAKHINTDIDIDSYLIPFIIDIDSLIDIRIHSIDTILNQLFANNPNDTVHDINISETLRKQLPIHITKESCELLITNLRRLKDNPIIVVYKLDLSIFGNKVLDLGNNIRFQIYNIFYDTLCNIYKVLIQIVIEAIDDIKYDSPDEYIILSISVITKFINYIKDIANRCITNSNKHEIINRIYNYILM